MPRDAVLSETPLCDLISIVPVTSLRYRMVQRLNAFTARFLFGDPRRGISNYRLSLYRSVRLKAPPSHSSHLRQCGNHLRKKMRSMRMPMMVGSGNPSQSRRRATPSASSLSRCFSTFHAAAMRSFQLSDG